ncbi:helix-turn-helix domain-containing protein [Burkholderia cenocepacia]|uniref:HNH endonuclease n=1 Tax=Burkholderia cenocepacia TaxID=95486 RepID=UPI0022316934|nr:HNH endonuclease [Burkholderia cenocepacia]MCW3676203.1 HNH endonuclease [Burkholderia cenocepacia]
MTTIERFESRIERIPGVDCWIFHGHQNKSGHVTFKPTGERNPINAQRFAYRAYVGDPGTYFVLHTCDVACCVNPAHLYLGTPKDNTRDMIVRGRHGGKKIRNENSPRCKLTDRQISEIRRRRELGETMASLAKDFAVWPGSIFRIVHFQTRAS